MGTRASRLAPGRFLAVLLAAVLVGCDNPRPSPSAGPTATESALPTKTVGDLALEACDPGGLLPCEHQAAVLVEPVAATGVSLTYSTEWADGRLDRPSWNADALGLGGWALDVVQRYDAERGILLSGDGSWRFASAAELANGERAVPTYDGLSYFVFDAAWHHVRTVDAITGATLWTLRYDDAGRLLEVQGRGAGAPVDVTVERDAGGVARGLAGLGSTRTSLVTDRDGRLSAVARPDQTFLTVAYTDFGLITTWSITGRGAVRYDWDEAGRAARVTDADGVSRNVTFTASAGSVRTAATDANGGVATLATERANDVVRRTFTDTDGTATVLETHVDGSTRLVEADGTVTTAGASAHPRWGLAAPVITPILETRPDGTEYHVETSSTMGSGTPEPAGGPWETTTMIAGQPWLDSYDPADRTLTTTDPAGRKRVQQFDADGRVTARRIAGQPAVTFAYGAEGSLSSRTVGEGPTAITSSYTYDRDAGEVVLNRGDGTTVRGTFDAFGTLQRAATADENVTLSRDAARAVLQLRPGAHPATSFGYSAAGRPTAYIPPVVGKDAWYELTTYTPAGQVASVASPAGGGVEMAYDEAGRPVSWTFDRGTSTVSYAQTGLLQSTTSPDGVTATFAHDGWVSTGMSWAGPVKGDVQVVVNGLLQATSQSVNGGQAIAFGYDAAGLLTSIGDLRIERDPATGLAIRKALGKVVMTSTYDSAGRLVRARTTAGAATLASVTYTRDASGRVIQVERTQADGESTSLSFGYDGSGRLSSFGHDGVTATYVYDATGNRVAVDPGVGVAIKATYDDRDRILKQGKDTFRHSPDGTLLERQAKAGTTRYDFDDLGALRSVELSDGRTIEYVLDAGGRRIGRKVDGVLTEAYLYSVDDSIAATIDATGRVTARYAYDHQGLLALVQRDGRDLLVVTDQLGSPIALIDTTTGKVVGETGYDAWGNRTGGDLSRLLPFGFGGGLLDPDTGLVHFGLRDYDPTTARWTAPDPLRFAGGDSNLYRYATGDPVNFVDPTGTTTCGGRSCGAAAAGGVRQVRPLPVGGRRTGGTTGGSGGGGKPAGGSKTGGSKTYRDTGPKNISNPPPPAAPGGGGTKPAGGGAPPSSAAAPPPATPSTPPASAPATPPPAGIPPTTLCFSGPCYTPNGPNPGASSGVEGDNAEATACFGLCLPLGGPGQGFCIGVCAGGSDQGQFVCIIACSYGDPHMLSADSGHLDFQGAGEFVVSKSADGSLEIQARFAPRGTTVTLTKALALRVAGDRVAFYTDPGRQLVVNGDVIDRVDYAATLPGGGSVERHGSAATVTWPDGSQLVINLYGYFMNFGFNPSDEIAPSLVGLFGSHDGNVENDLRTRDGDQLSWDDPALWDSLHGRFADSWRITDAESLFDYLPGESTATFQLHDIPTEPATVDTLDPGDRSAAEALCRAVGVTADPILSDCVLDVVLMADPATAGSAATVVASLAKANIADIDLGTAVERGERIAGSLAPGAIDRYHVTAAAGDIVYLDAEGACGANLAWRLMRPNGGLATFADACADIGRWVLPVAGEWRIEVYSDDASAGPYAFRVLTVAAPQEKAIAPGDSASGTTTTPGEWHRYRLAAKAGDVVYLDATGDCASPMSWRLLRPDGGLTTFEKTCIDLGRRVLDVAGDWVIEVFAEGTEAGSYAFRVIGAPATREGDVTPGQTVTDATTRIGEWHRYALTAKKGQVVYLDALGDCHAGLNWQLLRPDGGLRTFARTCDDLGRWVLDVAGDWSIEVFAPELATGPYSFRVIGAPAVKTAALRAGTKVSGTIGAVGEWHRYTLAAEAGQKIVIDAQGDCIDDLWWRLLRPDGTLTTFAKSCTDSDTRTLDVAGDWVVEVYSDTLATGPYAFTVKPG